MQKLTARDGAAEDRFGNSVAISGNNLVIGSAYDSTPTELNPARHTSLPTLGAGSNNRSSLRPTARSRTTLADQSRSAAMWWQWEPAATTSARKPVKDRLMSSLLPPALLRSHRSVCTTAWLA